ncbi:MAG: heat-inducible transcriptional repressor HrcA, partial [Anaerolineae bacterium]|nr:heat-inducible transcriptional repressor HrcA [Anaerolineae bacterium]
KGESAKIKKVKMELSNRQKFILTLVVHEYIRTAAPVGSKTLVEQYRLEMSPATVRNELSYLTDAGYLRQPHTSAGRVPTEEGYRYFVGRLLRQTDLPDSTQHMISHQFYQTRPDMEEWMKLAASILASQSRAASLVTAPHSEKVRFKHVELVSTRGQQVLLVLVLAGGEIRQRIVTLDQPVNQDQLSKAAERIRNIGHGMDIEELSLLRQQFNELERDALDWISEELRMADNSSGEVYLDGLTNVMAEPEFSGSDSARRALRVLEERSLLQEVVERSVTTSSIGGVQVIIGGEGTWEELRPFSMVLGRYGKPGLATGALGVLGPLRMSYGKTISTVRFLSNLLSSLVTETLAD